MKLVLNGHSLHLEKPALMGILNLTPDSFSDGGQYNELSSAIDRIDRMHKSGASIIDLGAESTRPGSLPVSEKEELSRLLPVLDKIPKDQFIISIDSNKFSVQKECIYRGAHLVNDVFGGSKDLFKIAEKYQIALVLMHSSGTPDVMQSKTDYEDVLDDILYWMEDKRNTISDFDIPYLCMDPGIGFGKTLEQNLTLMANIDRFKKEGFNILLGSSRKSWIGKLVGAPVDERLPASLISAIYGISQGCDILRVHDVAETDQAIKTYSELEKYKNG